MGNYTIFRCSKIPGEAGKQEILQQMFRKFYISNLLPNRYFPKIDVGCPWLKVQARGRPLQSSLVNKYMFKWWRDCTYFIQYTFDIPVSFSFFLTNFARGREKWFALSNYYIDVSQERLSLVAYSFSLEKNKSGYNPSCRS